MHERLSLNNRMEYEGMKDAKVVLYDGPTTLKDAKEEDLVCTNETQRDIALMHCVDVKVYVNGQECYVYDTNVNHSRQWNNDFLPALSRTPVAYFDFEGQVDIEVVFADKTINSVKISPFAEKVEAVISADQKRICFALTKPGNYTVQFNDSYERALHLFTNAIETDIPDKEDENVLFFEAGEWEAGSIEVKDGQTVYIAGGAVVHGKINVDGGKDITVKGRGILDGSRFMGWHGHSQQVPLQFDHCENIRIENIIVLNSNAWVCQGFNSVKGVIDGLRIVSARPNGDGITLQSCEHYEVKNCFVRSWDDSLVIKNYDRNTNEISFKDIQIWTDLAQSMEVGYETNKGKREAASIRKVSFEDITVLNNYHKPVISVHNADDAVVSDITFRNIVIEHNEIGSGDGIEMPYLIDINIAQNRNWSSTQERGSIKDICIENVEVLSGNFPKSRINGFDSKHMVENVTIKNVTVLGQKITDFDKGKFEINIQTTANLRIE